VSDISKIIREVHKCTFQRSVLGLAHSSTKSELIIVIY
jgi:hypothetical protein